MHIETTTIHTGCEVDSTYNAVITPIYATSTFALNKLGETCGFDYTRSGNPTRKALEDTLAVLENGAAATATASGMAAIMAVLSLLGTGDHLIAPVEIYGGTHRLFSQVAPQFGIEVTFINNPNDLDELECSCKQNTKLLWIETPSNPLLKVTDIQASSQLIKSINPLILLAADNTFMSPCFQKPLDLGCDIVIHSTTKYINGHSDVVGGAVISKTVELAKRINYYVNCMGLAGSPFDTWLVARGLKTLPQRMKVHERNAQLLVEFLQEHELVKKVFYPGLKNNPQAELISKQMNGFGGVLSFVLDSSKANIDKFFASLKYFQLAVSLGGVESLIAQPWSMSHASMPENVRLKAGITPDLIRISAGIENHDDLISDLKQAFENCCWS